MAELTITGCVDAPLEQVWASWDDFGNIYRFNPTIASSKLLSEQGAATAVGTRRECEFNDGRNWVRERVTEYEPRRLLALELYEGSIPVSTLNARFEFASIEKDATEIRITASFEPKGGLLGKILVPLLRRQFRRVFGALLAENAVYVEKDLLLQQAA